jgi:hypothetical protein
VSASMRVFEKRLLRRVFGTKEEGVTRRVENTA